MSVHKLQAHVDVDPRPGRSLLPASTPSQPDPLDVLWMACRLRITPMPAGDRRQAYGRLMRLVDGKGGYPGSVP